jgi:hypothetical protein
VIIIDVVCLGIQTWNLTTPSPSLLFAQFLCCPSKVFQIYLLLSYCPHPNSWTLISFPGWSTFYRLLNGFIGFSILVVPSLLKIKIHVLFFTWHLWLWMIWPQPTFCSSPQAPSRTLMHNIWNYTSHTNSSHMLFLLSRMSCYVIPACQSSIHPLELSANDSCSVKPVPPGQFPCTRNPVELNTLFLCSFSTLSITFLHLVLGSHLAALSPVCLCLPVHSTKH